MALPRAWVEDATTQDTGRGTIRFIGNATVLIEWAGMAVLTDPNFIHRHEKVDLGGGLSATRQTDPALEIDELPPLDLVVLSHFHGDHFDQVAEERLDRSVTIVTTPEAEGKLIDRGFRAARGLATWESSTIRSGEASLTVTSMPGRHGPPVISFALPDVMGSVLDFEGPQGRYRLYITGDTLLIDDLREIPSRFPGIDLALLHLGGTTVMGLMVTMDAEQGVETIRRVEPRLAAPIHYDDYDVFASGLDDFRAAVREARLEDRVRYLERGEAFSFDLRPA